MSEETEKLTLRFDWDKIKTEEQELQTRALLTIALACNSEDTEEVIEKQISNCLTTNTKLAMALREAWEAIKIDLVNELGEDWRNQ